MATAALVGLGMSAGTAATTISTLSTIGTVFSGLSSIAGGISQSRNFEQQAIEERQQARATEIQASEKANEIRRDLLKTISASNAAFASRGISISGGTPEQAVVESRKAGTEDIKRAIAGGKFAKSTGAAQARQLESSASSAIFSGALKGASTISKADFKNTLFS